MVGQKFKTLNSGEVVVKAYINAENVVVEFLDTGTVTTTAKRTLVGRDRPRLRDPLAKTVFGVGCIGIGRHKAHVKRADTKAFSIWRAMLRRCYYRGGRHHQSSYEGVTVCEEWLNFQVFAEWFELHYPKDSARYQLDKDKLNPKAKEYSPNNCSFISQQDNLAARWGRG